MTVAAFMDLALYDPEFGYYARAAQRSGRAGDFFTSVDVGGVFGELLEVQLAEMFALLKSANLGSEFRFDLVEAGAGNGRLSADILRSASRRDPAFFESTQLHLVEASAKARARHREALGEVAGRLASSTSSLPASFQGVLLANELLDAFPVHQVVMCADGLREVYVTSDSHAGSGGQLVLVEGPPSTPRLEEYLVRLGVALEPGWRVEINLNALEWIRDAANRLIRGFIIVIDYGHGASELYSQSHSAGTLTAIAKHQMAGPELPGRPRWLLDPGERDITAHVDFTSVQRTAEEAGLTTLAFLDQAYFLLGILGSQDSHSSPGARGAAVANLENLKTGLALKTLILPGGLGSTHKVLILGKGVGAPSLVGCPRGNRVT
jgi:SAM-dependent MidA family methyltransferase